MDNRIRFRSFQSLLLQSLNLSNLLDIYYNLNFIIISTTYVENKYILYKKILLYLK